MADDNRPGYRIGPSNRQKVHLPPRQTVGAMSQSTDKLRGISLRAERVPSADNKSISCRYPAHAIHGGGDAMKLRRESKSKRPSPTIHLECWNARCTNALNRVVAWATACYVACEASNGCPGIRLTCPAFEVPPTCNVISSFIRSVCSSRERHMVELF